jgi:hypothetical protein
MKHLMYGLAAISALSFQLVNACPFTFINNGPNKVLIHDTKDDKNYYAAAGKSVYIPGAIANEPTLWIYVEKSAGTFTPVYGINEEMCMPEGTPATILKWSQLAGLAKTNELHGGLLIRPYNKEEHPTVASEITYHELRRSL